AEDYVVHFARLNAGAGHGRGNDMAAHGRAVRDIERAFPALAEWGAGSGNNDGVGHAGFSSESLLVWRFVKMGTGCTLTNPRGWVDCLGQLFGRIGGCALLIHGTNPQMSLQH